MENPNTEPQFATVHLQRKITCPHCWHVYAPEESLWISAHRDLRGDFRLGGEQPRRFLPSRFNVQGLAIDARGFPCKRLACPRCHLDVPRAALTMKELFFSILGTPGCGKSFFLTSMMWRLEQVLPERFALTKTDADPVANAALNQDIDLLFKNPKQDDPVTLRKTQREGDAYDSVNFGDQVVNYLRPLSFALNTTDAHPRHGPAHRSGRVLCLYDNAGEDFLPGADTVDRPVIDHLSHSQLLLFLFDPTQDPNLRAACRELTQDPQLSDDRPASSQKTVLDVALDKIRLDRGLDSTDKDQRPLVVVVTKFDTWAPLLKIEKLRKPWVRVPNHPLRALDVEYLRKVSQRLRGLLRQFTPEIVTAAEGFTDNVLYVPVSATGTSMEINPNVQEACVRPRNVRPIWAEVPMLYALSTEGMIGVTKNAAVAAN